MFGLYQIPNFSNYQIPVMAGLVPATQNLGLAEKIMTLCALTFSTAGMGGRDKPGHDG
jgi:hypothetical protein